MRTYRLLPCLHHHSAVMLALLTLKTVQLQPCFSSTIQAAAVNVTHWARSQQPGRAWAPQPQLRAAGVGHSVGITTSMQGQDSDEPPRLQRRSNERRYECTLRRQPAFSTPLWQCGRSRAAALAGKPRTLSHGRAAAARQAGAGRCSQSPSPCAHRGQRAAGRAHSPAPPA